MKTKLSIASIILMLMVTLGAANASAYTSYNTLSVSMWGSGSGTVSSSPSGINCGYLCSKSYSYGTYVTLYATPASGSTFSGWSGACYGYSSSCTVSMTSFKSVYATFTAAPRYNLYVYKTGSGSGTVTSSPSGINCGYYCSASATSGTYVTLYASASYGSKFSGWTGACIGYSSSCTVSMSYSKSVTAKFTRW